MLSRAIWQSFGNILKYKKKTYNRSKFKGGGGGGGGAVAPPSWIPHWFHSVCLYFALRFRYVLRCAFVRCALYLVPILCVVFCVALRFALYLVPFCALYFCSGVELWVWPCSSYTRLKLSTFSRDITWPTRRASTTRESSCLRRTEVLRPRSDVTCFHSTAR